MKKETNEIPKPGENSKFKAVEEPPKMMTDEEIMAKAEEIKKKKEEEAKAQEEVKYTLDFCPTCGIAFGRIVK